MNRLIEYTVFSGLRIACRRAIWPTSRSPVFVKPTTEGVSRLPSALAMTVGSPPMIAAITELVVPRSIPTTLAIDCSSYAGVPASVPSARAASLLGPGGAGRSAFFPAPPARLRRRRDLLRDLDLHRGRLRPLRLRDLDLEDAVLVRGLGIAAVDLRRQRQRADIGTVPQLAPVVGPVLLLLVLTHRALDRDRVAGHGDVHVRRIDVGHLRPHHDLVARLEHLHGGL